MVDEYDKGGKLSYKHGPEKYLTQQWLIFQVSGKRLVQLSPVLKKLFSSQIAGQGPYFGQAAWFARFHPERLPSATTRYIDEIERVVSVVDRALGANKNGDSAYLVGDRCTYADLSFVTWANVAKGLLVQLGEAGRLDKFENYRAWMERMEQRSVVKSANGRIEQGRKAHNFP